ncbi:glycoside hydrolase family 16 protein [Shewanella corallii]|uniref:Glycoside hydrolase family 16 protein n=1 Tax=Shewanella corallii TaxID=560080 RepID=A0ABT0N4Z1_9GAMM|nr:glycoside hydrolase family 16 protein [Shewanella corallii]MCL2913499.1 glycoside hydrolase family 16 protein [Shewanella corallii]
MRFPIFDGSLMLLKLKYSVALIMIDKKAFIHMPLLFATPLLLLGCSGAGSEPDGDEEPGWQLVWQDEFDTLDTGKWSFEVNCWGGGNNEQQCYTDRSDNAYVKDGVLNIVARKENFNGPAVQDDQQGYDRHDKSGAKPFTSARLRSKNKGDWTYGRFEIRAKLPQGQGTWPAIWMLPTDNKYGLWPASGEIDIMEAVNLGSPSDRKGAAADEVETRVHGTLHYGREWPQNVYTGTGYRLPDNLSPTDDFHVYAIEWEPGEIRWYVDGQHYATQRAEGWYSQFRDVSGNWVSQPADAPFNARFHMILNLAVGGAWSANVNDKGIDEKAFPQTLSVDYVRVYRCGHKKDPVFGCGRADDGAELVEGKIPPAGDLSGDRLANP